MTNTIFTIGLASSKKSTQMVNILTLQTRNGSIFKFPLSEQNTQARNLYFLGRQEIKKPQNTYHVMNFGIGPNKTLVHYVRRNISIYIRNILACGLPTIIICFGVFGYLVCINDMQSK